MLIAFGGARRYVSARLLAQVGGSTQAPGRANGRASLAGGWFLANMARHRGAIFILVKVLRALIRLLPVRLIFLRKCHLNITRAAAPSLDISARILY